MKERSITSTFLAAPILSLSLGLVAPLVLAHGDATQHKAKMAAPISTEEKSFGRQGDPKKVNRTITIDMKDTMRFNPSDLAIKQGETIRIVVKNRGAMLHEMVLGTMTELKEHGEMMRKHPGMEHDEPYMSHVRAKKKEEMVWQFTNAGEFHFACLVPGHFEAGMVGKIKVVPT